jgi:hypothetical protein
MMVFGLTAQEKVISSPLPTLSSMPSSLSALDPLLCGGIIWISTRALLGSQMAAPSVSKPCFLGLQLCSVSTSLRNSKPLSAESMQVWIWVVVQRYEPTLSLSRAARGRHLHPERLDASLPKAFTNDFTRYAWFLAAACASRNGRNS